MTREVAPLTARVRERSAHATDLEGIGVPAALKLLFPKSDGRRNHYHRKGETLSFRVEPELAAHVRRLASLAGVTATDWCRRAVTLAEAETHRLHLMGQWVEAARQHGPDSPQAWSVRLAYEELMTGPYPPWCAYPELPSQPTSEQPTAPESGQ